MENIETKYIDLIAKILRKVDVRDSRNGKTLNYNPTTLVWNYKEGLPVFTHRKIFWKTAAVETAWITKGLSNIDYLHKYNVHIWDQFADGKGFVPNSYGPPLRNFFGVDQLERILNNMLNPSRRLVVSYWNPSDKDQEILPPCHYTWQLIPYGKYMDMVVTLRSSDVLVGLPYDILHYTIMFISLCKSGNYKPGQITFQINIPHIYLEHSHIARDILQKPLYDFTNNYYIPEMTYNGINPEDIVINYNNYNPVIKLKAIL